MSCHRDPDDWESDLAGRELRTEQLASQAPCTSETLRLGLTLSAVRLAREDAELLARLTSGGSYQRRLLTRIVETLRAAERLRAGEEKAT